MSSTENLGGSADEGAEEKAPLLHLYLDDSGSRHLDKSSANNHPRWFALGGILVNAEDESSCKGAYDHFLNAWPKARAPLHMTDMRSERKNWSWLERLTDDERTRFWREYRAFLTRLPVLGTACVIDRPGYHGRGYGSREGDEKWLLCRSAFDILVERAAKFAVLNKRRLRVMYEGVNPDTDKRIEGYFKNLKADGLAFDSGTSAKYSPLKTADLGYLLLDIERKDKRSKMMQVADSYLYAIAKGGYDRKFDVYRRIVETRHLVTSQVEGRDAGTLGVKYYCFDHR